MLTPSGVAIRQDEEEPARQISGGREGLAKSVVNTQLLPIRETSEDKFGDNMFQADPRRESGKEVVASSRFQQTVDEIAEKQKHILEQRDAQYRTGNTSDSQQAKGEQSPTYDWDN